MTDMHIPYEAPKYTLDEARKILDRQECDDEGHDIDVTVVNYLSGTATAQLINCRRCGARFEEVK